jgi:hypothetical protein
MLILSHRGYWGGPIPKNSPEAFERSFRLGFGTETDFRDHDGELVISHDPPTGTCLTVADFLRAFAAIDMSLPLAVNIKADGLQEKLKDAFDAYQIENYFLFDMSVPDAIVSLKNGLTIFTRHSDVETTPHLYKESAGVWLDAFFDDSWITADGIIRHLDAGKRVCVVSPELHSRPHLSLWDRLQEGGIHCHPDLMLCTDIPEEARAFFPQ